MKTPTLTALAALAFTLLILSLGGCGDQDTQEITHACNGKGAALKAGAQDLCVYERAVVIETGFLCPPDLDRLQEHEDIGVCSEGGLEETELPGVRERFREDFPDPTPLPTSYCTDAMPCPSGETCNQGRCEEEEANPPLTCEANADCGADEACESGECVPASGEPRCEEDNDGDGICAEEDCDDNNPDIPSEEIPGDAIDNDCDGEVDEAPDSSCEADSDCNPNEVCVSGICQRT